MTASKSNLDKLNKIQNSCLRLALGARKTSPIISLEIESNIPPLFLRREFLLTKYYFKLCLLPKNSPVTIEIFDTDDKLFYKGWTTHVRMPPVIVRSQKQLMAYQFPQPETQFTDIVSPFPPWYNNSLYLKSEFSASKVENIDSITAIQIFKNMKYKIYPLYTEIYTDGSVIQEPNLSASAAMIIMKETDTIMQNWKLSPLLSILGAELHAIHEALSYVSHNIINANGIVIYTDSQSSIALIANRYPKTYINLIYKIQKLILSLNSRFLTVIQYIPGHKDIRGNETADLAAKAGHNLSHITDSHLSVPDKMRLVRDIQRRVWTEYWYDQMRESGKGHFLYKIKKETSHWPWASNRERAVETAMCRLRIGHAGLNKHLHRFEMSATDKCSCGLTETIEHFMFQCSNFTVERTALYLKLSDLNVPMTLGNMLGGGAYNKIKQKKITDAVSYYLRKTGKLHDI